jgi:hypothetical protein
MLHYPEPVLINQVMETRRLRKALKEYQDRSIWIELTLFENQEACSECKIGSWSGNE